MVRDKLGNHYPCAHLFANVGRVGDVSLEYQTVERHRVVGGERRPADEKLIDQDTERPPVGKGLELWI